MMEMIGTNCNENTTHPLHFEMEDLHIGMLNFTLLLKKFKLCHYHIINLTPFLSEDVFHFPQKYFFTVFIFLINVKYKLFALGLR